MRKILWLLLVVPLTTVMAVFAIANRQSATVDLWPFQILVELPVFILALGSLSVGLLAGAFLIWVPLVRWRLRAGRRERRVQELESALAKAEAALASQPAATPPGAQVIAP